MKPWRLPAHSGVIPAFPGLDPLCAGILVSRGITSPEAAAAFLHGGILHDPSAMRGMERAVAVIEEAMSAGELIAVYGDYDCDGMTATVLLYRYLEERGAKVAYYIPDREKEGYGLNREACRALAESGVKLVITVDNGVSAHEEVAYLYELGLRVVITDHHQPRETLPACEAVLNPHRADDEYPFKDLAGVGVAFKLVCALEGDDAGFDTLRRFADLVCIGTIADVVPLTGENRVIAAEGLRCLSESENPGLRALLAVSGLSPEKLGAQSVSFGLAPRLNAASRLGKCDQSVELLLCEDEAEAARLAAEVDTCNQRRRALEEGILREIAAQIAENPALVRGRVLVLAGAGWHHGVIGIAAARVMQRYGRPVLLLSILGEEARGSARSIPGFSIIDAVSACASVLTRYGGHPLAAGVSLAAKDIPRLREMLEEEAARLCPDMPRPELSVDVEITPAQGCDLRQAEALMQLEPFGAGNEQPVLLLRNVRVEGLDAIGNGAHLRARLSAGGRFFQAVGFRMTPETFPIPQGRTGDLCVTLTVNEYNGTRRPSLQILDAHPAGFRQEQYLEEIYAYERFSRGEALSAQEAGRLTPSRGQTALVWRAVRGGGVSADPDALASRLGAWEDSPPISPGQVRIAADVLIEAGLIAREGEKFRIVPAEGKTDLTQTAILCDLYRRQKGCEAP